MAFKKTGRDAHEGHQGFVTPASKTAGDTAPDAAAGAASDARLAELLRQAEQTPEAWRITPHTERK